MEQTWRWFGPDDAVTLRYARQAGASGIVTALHQIPAGQVWNIEAIEERRRLIEHDASLGLRWSVVESLPVAEPIKIGEGDLTRVFDDYRASLRNLAACGVRTVCYNFMPVLDWTRTVLRNPLPGGGTGLRFNAHEFAAFDCLMLQRPGAEADHPPDVLRRARTWFDGAAEGDRAQLLASIMAGLPGAFDRYDLPGLRRMLARYADVSADRLREHLARFLREVCPVAEEVGIRLAIHPDDPPRPLLGLPRIVSNASDIDFILRACESPANGLTLCTGSLGAGDNDLPAITKTFARRIHFVHLRNVSKEPDGSFFESDHLGGDVDMVAVVATLLREQKRRREAGDARWRIPFRPDHGHELIDDASRRSHPGYPAVGRLKGLAEIRGVMTAVAALERLPT
jgi:mannonate dehydratase